MNEFAALGQTFDQQLAVSGVARCGFCAMPTARRLLAAAFADDDGAVIVVNTVFERVILPIGGKA